MWGVKRFAPSAGGSQVDSPQSSERIQPGPCAIGSMSRGFCGASRNKRVPPKVGASRSLISFTVMFKGKTRLMKFHLDKILEEYAQCAFDTVHLGRDAAFEDRTRILTETLSELEIDGYAMRYLDRKGRIAWKATPRLRDLINDLWRDAQADAEEEDA